MKQIILASTSPRRKELFYITRLPFITEAPNYEEDMALKLSPENLAKYLSMGKAQAVAKRHKNALIIAADTFVILGNKVLGKPHTREKASSMLRMLSGKSHLLITGLAIIDTHSGKTVSKTNKTKVFFRKLSPTEINAYVKTGEPLDKAGAYAIQGLGAFFIKRIEGDYQAALGLPLFDLGEELKKFGVKVG